MSFIQSRPDKNAAPQYRKTGRSAAFSHPRNSSPAYAAKGGSPAPSPFHPASVNSFKRDDNAQSVQPRPSFQHWNHQPQAHSNSVASSPLRNVADGPSAHSHTNVVPGTTSKPAETTSILHRAAETAQKTITSHSTSTSSDPRAPATLVKAPRDASEGVSFQFGSLSPGFANEIQTPGKTSCLHQTIDEQKQVQARNDAHKFAPAAPLSPAAAEQLPRKNLGSADYSGAAQVLSTKKDTQTQFAYPDIQVQVRQHPIHEASRMSVPMTFHRPQIPAQLGSPNPHFQSHGMLPSSIPTQMLANSPSRVLHQMLVQGIQPHQMPPQPILHQNQGLSFPPLPALLGNSRMAIRQYPQQQGGQFGGPRKMPVKITHPDTRQEVMLDTASNEFSDGVSLSRSSLNVPPQSQPRSSHPPDHQSNNYHSSYASALYSTGPGSVVPSSQMTPTSQGPRLNHSVSQGPQSASLVNPQANSMLHSDKTGTANRDTVLHACKEPSQNSHDETSALSSAVMAAVKQPDGSSDLNTTNLSPSYRSAATLKIEPPKLSAEYGESSPKDSEVSAAGPLPKPRTNWKPASFDLQSGKTENNSIQASAASHGCVVNSSSVDLITPDVPKSFLAKAVGGISENSSIRSSSGNSAEHYEVANDCLLLQVEERAPAISSSTAHGSPKVRPEQKEGEQISIDKVEGNENAKQCAPCTIDSSGGSEGNKVPFMPVPDRSSSITGDKVAGSTDTAVFGLQEKSGSNEDVHGTINGKGGSVHILGSNDKSVPEFDRSKSMTIKGKKKRKEFLQKADAAGSTSDLYMAYKGPDERKQTIIPSETRESDPGSFVLKVDPADAQSSDNAVKEDAKQSEAPDDWEDAADVCNHKLETATFKKSANHQDSNGSTGKKYSRDFLLKFAEHCTSLPENFQVTSNIAEAFQQGSNLSRSIGRDHHQSHGRPGTGSRLDRRGSNVRDDDRWTKVPGAFPSGQDLRLNVGLGGNVGFQTAQGVNYGVLRHPYAHSPMQYPGGMLPGLMQTPGSQGGMPRTGSDADRWQRAANFQQKGLMPSPQTPMQIMHKAEKKYEVGKTTDGEQAKQRQLKAIFNKLTPQNFEKLFEQVIAVQIDSAITLTGLISQIFDKALLEPTFCEMYANLCSHLSHALPDFQEDNVKITFKRLLLNKCQEEFERGEREQEEADKVEEEGKVKQTKEEREEKRIKAQRRMLGNIRLIGELYKKRMLTEKIMHECMKKLLGQHPTQIPDEEDLEALCKLLSTIGEMIDHPKAKSHMDVYFERMTALSNNMALSSRVRFMLKDAIDLRKNKWQQRRKVEGPKKIEEVHRDAQQERHALAGRAGRSHGMMSSGRRGQQREFSSRGSPSSPNAQRGGFRSVSMQTRGFEERQTYEPRPLAVPFPQKSGGDDVITLGPQGGLGRGLSVRGPSSVLRTSLSDISSGGENGRKTQVGTNDFSSVNRTNISSSREDSVAERHMQPVLSDQLNVQSGRNRSPRYNSDSPFSASHSRQLNGPSSVEDDSSEKSWPEERLHDKSLAAIREYYSAKDEKEVALCIEDLKSPSFYPSMISLWVTDSFERKDMERDLLTKLLISLCKPPHAMLSQTQLIQGFEMVLTNLEDAVNDAPKSPHFLGRMFAGVVVENVVPLSEVARMLYEGGEEHGQLVEAGLAAVVLGGTLEIIQSDKGDATLSELRRGCNLKLEDFRPPGPMSSTMLEKFIC